MALTFTFDLVRVSELAEHAMTAPAHADPLDDEPRGPALLMAVDDGVYLLSNGDPQLPPAAEQPPHAVYRVAHSHEAPSMLTPGVYQDPADRTSGYASIEATAAAGALRDIDCYIFPLPLTTNSDDTAVLIDVIRTGTGRGHRLLRMTFDRGGDNPPTITTA